MEVNLPEIWKYRELLYIFAWRDIKVRYKQTIFGIGWAIFQPFVTMVILSVIFGRLAAVPSEGIPYPIFLYTGLLLWNYFSSALTSASDCLVSNEGIIKKVYFPRLILPLSTAVTPLVDFCFAFLVLIGMMIYFHYTPTLLGIVFLPILLLISLLSASGLGFFLASVNVKFRDVRYILPFLIQLLLYITPVIYPLSIIPEKYRWIMLLNPMTGILSFARATMLGSGSVDWLQLGFSGLISLIILFLGIVYFRKTERFFADIL